MSTNVHRPKHPITRRAPLSRWQVLRSQFPFGAPTEVLGTVTARGRRSAEICAEQRWGVRIVVEPVTTLDDAA